MSMLDVYQGRKNRNIKARLLKPIYDDNKKITYYKSDKFCFCSDGKFTTQSTIVNNRRFKETNGILITTNLEQDEITIDWKIEVDGKEYIIIEMTQEDDDLQQENMRSGVMTTTLKVRC